ncbi:MAG: hypothetical protein GY854_34105 [Deltaproteobacteria bacterium]|nr:hypothetical protein [Deltaproteobacteria bacterium]
MGFFSSRKNKGANASQAADEAVTTRAVAGNVGEYDDPMWAPIQGITVEKYAEITAALGKANIMGIENVAAFAENFGVPQGTWQEVQTGWVQRMSANETVRVRYGNIYSELVIAG